MQKVGRALGTACQHFQHTGGDRVTDHVLVKARQCVSLPRKFDVTSLTNAVSLRHRLVMLVCVELACNICDIILVNLTDTYHKIHEKRDVVVQRQKVGSSLGTACQHFQH